MPNPLARFHRESGLWLPGDLPRKTAVKVLEHLLLPGPPEPRLFIATRGGRHSASVSNAAEALGFTTCIDTNPLIQRGWVEKDPGWTRKSATGITAYRVTREGAEAVAQFYARLKYAEETISLAQRMIRECRALVDARRKR